MSITYLKIPGEPLAENVEVECPALITFFGGGVATVTLDGVIVAKLSATNPTKELKYPGTYKLTMPIGHCKNDGATITVHELRCTTPTPTLVCIKLKTDPMEIDNVINAWACVSCGGTSVSVTLFNIDDGELLTNPDDYEIL